VLLTKKRLIHLIIPGKMIKYDLLIIFDIKKMFPFCPEEFISDINLKVALALLLQIMNLN